VKEINWAQVGNQYIAELEHGSVVISPCYPPNHERPYGVQIKTASGEIVAVEAFDLEACKSWDQVNLPLMDQQSNKLYHCGNVVETLEICQGLLSPETDGEHWLRIEHIKEWIGEYIGQPYEIAALSLPQNSPNVLNWVEEGTKFYMDTPDGRLVIRETRDKRVVGGGIRHVAQIIHRSGAVLDCGSFIDFLDAETALKTQVAALSSPHIGEAHLDCVAFTLDICARLLPEYTDSIHYARLGNLETTIHLALD
jgi:hypothetical protein